LDVPVNTPKTVAPNLRRSIRRADPALADPVAMPADGERLTADQIRLALSGKIEPVRTTALYGLWIAIVAAVMVLLPLIYVSMIGLLVAGLVYHAVHDVTVFETLGRDKNAMKAAFALYVGPLVIGGVVVLFMRVLGRFADTALVVEESLEISPITIEETQTASG
jgi:hypothetical protein